MYVSFTTKNFSVEFITALMSPEYQHYHLACSASDVGHSGCTRDRTYIIFRHVELTDCLYDPQELYYEVTQEIKSKVSTQPQDYMIATKEEIMMETLATCRLRQVAPRPYGSDLKYLLTDRERRVLDFASRMYMENFRRPASSDPNLAVYLGDNVEWSLTWSATSGRIPTFRMSSGKMYFPFFQRWMCHSEKLATFGFPVRQHLAEMMGTPILPIKDERRAAGLAGNAMVLPTVAIVQLVALACVAAKETTGNKY